MQVEYCLQKSTANYSFHFFSVFQSPYVGSSSSSAVAEEIRKAKSVIMNKKKDREGSAPVKSRAQQLLSRNEVK